MKQFAVLAAALQCALTIPLAYVLNIWQDEAYTLHSIASGPAFAFHEALAFEQNAPLYFVVLSIWHAAGSSPLFLRSFSIGCAAATVLLVPAIGARYARGVDVRWLTAAVAFNPFLIWAAVEMRAYALIILLSAALLVVFYDAFLSEDAPRGMWIAYAALCAAALYTQYYLAFLIAAQGIVLLARAAWPALVRFAGALAVAGIAFAPMLAIVPAQMANFRGIFTAPASPIAALGTLVSIVVRYVVPAQGLTHPLYVYGATLAAGAGVAIVHRRSLARTADWTLAFMTVTALVIFAVAIYATHEHVLNRHAASLFVPAEATFFAALAAFREPARARVVTAAACVLLLLSAVTLSVTYAHGAKPGDWIRVTSYLAQHERSGQPIAVFEAENALPLAYYYRGPNRIVAIPQAVDFHRYDVATFVIGDRQQLARTLPQSNRGVWLITAGECASANVQFGCPLLERYVAAHYKTLSDETFFESRVRLLVRTLAR